MALVWTLLPIYWFAEFAFETPSEIAHVSRRLLSRRDPQLAAFFNIFGSDYTLADGTVLPGLGPGRTRSCWACATA